MKSEIEYVKKWGKELSRERKNVDSEISQMKNW